MSWVADYTTVWLFLGKEYVLSALKRLIIAIVPFDICFAASKCKLLIRLNFNYSDFAVRPFHLSWHLLD